MGDRATKGFDGDPIAGAGAGYSQLLFAADCIGFTDTLPKSSIQKRRSEPAEKESALSLGSLKKTKSTANVRKEKLGERITALQQLVSPYGKTDTASVLHEAMGYIKFLQDQVRVLCSPYLQRPTSTFSEEGDENEGESWGEGLKSRGLCLVPVESTAHVSNTNGADFWSPAPAAGSVSSEH